MMTTIYIVRKHPPGPYSMRGEHLEAYTIVSTHSTAAAAKEEAARRNNLTRVFLFTVGRVSIKDRSKI